MVHLRVVWSRVDGVLGLPTALSKLSETKEMLVCRYASSRKARTEAFPR